MEMWKKNLPVSHQPCRWADIPSIDPTLPRCTCKEKTVKSLAKHVKQYDWSVGWTNLTLSCDLLDEHILWRPSIYCRAWTHVFAKHGLSQLTVLTPLVARWGTYFFRTPQVLLVRQSRKMLFWLNSNNN